MTNMVNCQEPNLGLLLGGSQFGVRAITWQAFVALCISSICVSSLHIPRSVRCGLSKKSAQVNTTPEEG